jgi:hypothetical protein
LRKSRSFYIGGWCCAKEGIGAQRMAFLSWKRGIFLDFVVSRVARRRVLARNARGVVICPPKTIPPVAQRS